MEGRHNSAPSEECPGVLQPLGFSLPPGHRLRRGEIVGPGASSRFDGLVAESSADHIANSLSANLPGVGTSEG